MHSLDLRVISPGAPRHVFVYGTLRRDEERDINRLIPTPRWVGNGRIRGLLYDLGNYPGLVVAAGEGSGHIRGEIYAITPVLERLLDAIEEVWPQQTGEYAKVEADVELDATDTVGTPKTPLLKLRCLVYEIHGLRVQGMLQITSGDWVLHRRERTT